MAVTTTSAPSDWMDVRGLLSPGDHVVVLFGATGDLARRKLIPGLYHLFVAGLLPPNFRLVASARSDSSDSDYRDLARAACQEFGRRELEESTWQQFASTISYAPSSAPDRLAKRVASALDELQPGAQLLHYLSIPPVASADVVRMLGAHGLADGARVIMEKPFGTDLESARALNATVHEVFSDDQVFRIDHFLGKEAVQNILALRFANGLFEPIWNREHIAQFQIDVPETLSIGTRAAFYERTGAFRDMIVTHLFQLLGFVAMEPPSSLSPHSLAAEKLKVFEAMIPLRPADAVRGQYDGYLAEEGVAPDSDTETFIALRVEVDNWRWGGVPFLLRTGKQLAQTRRVVTLTLREPPGGLFGVAEAKRSPAANTLSLELGEPGSISAAFLAKEPGATMQLGPATMRFDYSDSFCVANQLEAYERLIHDAMIGDHTLFTRSDGIERLWEISAPLLADPPPVESYAPGSWGPWSIERLAAPGRWYLPDDRSDA